MNTLAALNTLITLTTTLARLSESAQVVSAIIAKAQAEGRTDLTPEEWATITGADDAARQVLMQAIAQALKV